MATVKTALPEKANAVNLRQDSDTDSMHEAELEASDKENDCPAMPQTQLRAIAGRYTVDRVLFSKQAIQQDRGAGILCKSIQWGQRYKRQH